MNPVGLCFEGLEFQAFQRTVEWNPGRIVPLSHTSPPLLHSGTEMPPISARQEREHQMDGKQDLFFRFLAQCPCLPFKCYICRFQERWSWCATRVKCWQLLWSRWMASLQVQLNNEEYYVQKWFFLFFNFICSFTQSSSTV